MTDFVCEIKRLRAADLARHGWTTDPKTALSAGIDLIACIGAPLRIEPGEAVLVPAGIAVFIGRRDIVAKVYPRSGLGHKGLVLGNGTGVIDADYQGEIKMSLCNRKHGSRPEAAVDTCIVIHPGDRVAQLVFERVLHPTWREVHAFSTETERGDGGYGSTGR